jgi:hypothetical protein
MGAVFPCTEISDVVHATIPSWISIKIPRYSLYIDYNFFIIFLGVDLETYDRTKNDAGGLLNRLIHITECSTPTTFGIPCGAACLPSYIHTTEAEGCALDSVRDKSVSKFTMI